ncbi:MAG: heavy-metal-associated domain-containing protein [Bacteroidota bacterium]|nr:heavy-metal-associated domain-containing protein [Bacteroidota bacterium]
MNVFNPKIFSILLAFVLLACSDRKKEVISFIEPKTEVINGVAVSIFKVWGNCGMCKKTIERSLDNEAISDVNWNSETKMMEVRYDATKISLDDIQKEIASVGYDTPNYKGNDSSYANLHECCKYERKP